MDDSGPGPKPKRKRIIKVADLGSGEMAKVPDWWRQAANILIGKPDMPLTDLAQILGRKYSHIRHVVIDERFKKLMGETARVVTRTSEKQDAVTAMAKGLILSVSRGNLESHARKVLEAVLLADPTLLSKEAIAQADIALGVYKVHHAAVKIKNTLNVQNNTLNAGALTPGKAGPELLDPMLQEIFDAVQMSIPTKVAQKQLSNGSESIEVSWDDTSDEASPEARENDADEENEGGEPEDDDSSTEDERSPDTEA